MRALRTMGAMLIALFALIIMTPIAGADAVVQCDGFVVDQSRNQVLNHSAITAHARAVQTASRSNAEVYVRYVSELSEQYTSHVYDRDFRATCNPATDYILVVVGEQTAGVFFGSHFERLTPSLHNATKHYLSDFYGTDDRNRAILNLLGELIRIFDLNPEHDDYVKHPEFYLVNGYVDESHAPDEGLSPTTKAVIIATAIPVVFFVVILALSAFDKRTESQE